MAVVPNSNNLRGNHEEKSQRFSEAWRCIAAGAAARRTAGAWAGSAYASDAPETPNVRFGIIALTDCASIVMAHELGSSRSSESTR